MSDYKKANVRGHHEIFDDKGFVTHTEPWFLPEQVGIMDAGDGVLFCAKCGLVTATQEQIAYVAKNAKAAGFTKPEVRPASALVPGKLSKEERTLLSLALCVERDSGGGNAGLLIEFEKSKRSEGLSSALAHGYVTSSAKLTDAGRAMATMILDPPIDYDALPIDPTKAEPAKAKKKSKTTKKKEQAPDVNVMICARTKCGHGARAHESGRCHEGGCWCARFVVPVAPKRAPKKSSAAA